MEKKYRKAIRIAITGPESTGKTSLATELASHYNTLWVPEFSRSYLEELGRPYNEEDLVKIAKGQRKWEKDRIPQAKNYLFCDTDMFVMKIWSLHKFGRVDEQIQNWLDKKEYSLYLLCYPDLQWTSDPLRENPDGGDYFFKEFESELKDASVDYVVIRGKGNERLQTAINAIDTRF